MRSRDLRLWLTLWGLLVIAPAVITAGLHRDDNTNVGAWVGIVGYLVQIAVFMFIAYRAKISNVIGWFVPSILPWLAIWSVPHSMWWLLACGAFAVAFAHWIYRSTARSERVQHHGVPARGVVLEVSKPLMNVVVNNAYLKRTLRLRIERFDGAPAYEAKYRGTFMIGNIPSVGDTLALRIDPDRPQHFDVADDLDASAVGSVASDDIADQLQHVTELHRSGALTDDEFAAAKRRILGG